MNPIKTLVLAVPLALLALVAACGGTSADPAFVNAAPSFSSLSMEMTGTDTSTPSSYVIAPSNEQMTMMTGDGCHPHLFVRSHEVVARVNRHLYMFLNHVEALIAKDPTTATGTVHVWERVRNGVDVKFTITKTAPETFTWKLEMEPAGASTFTTVFSGQIDRTGATGPHQGTGSMTLELTALHEIIPVEPVQGTVTATFDVTATSRKLVVDASDVTWEVVGTDFAVDSTTMSNMVAVLEQPRNDHYVYYREPGKGGSLKITDQMVFLCPYNPQFKLADVELVSRWYKTPDGSIHGRSDAMMTGGQLPDITDPDTGTNDLSRIVGVTCHQSASETATTTAENFWLMKAEGPAPTYATVIGLDLDSSIDGITASACDPLLNQFGQPTTNVIVPTLADSSTDFDFSAINFTDDQPYPFPNM